MKWPVFFPQKKRWFCNDLVIHVQLGLTDRLVMFTGALPDELERFLFAQVVGVLGPARIADAFGDQLTVFVIDVVVRVVFVEAPDRAFIDAVVTSTLVFEGNGVITECAGGYADWQREMQARKPADGAKAIEKTTTSKQKQKSSGGKLSYKLQRELEQLPAQIETLETAIENLHAQLADPDLYRESPGRIAELKQQLADREAELERVFERWEELEALGGEARDPPGR